MGDSSSYPSVLQQFAALGGVSAVTGLLTWLTARRATNAGIRKTNAEIAKIEVETHTESLNSVEHARAEFEKTLNERTTRVMDSLEKQVAHLSELVETQNRQLRAQAVQMQQMEDEIRSLRRALDEKTSPQVRVQHSSPTTSPEVVSFRDLNLS